MRLPTAAASEATTLLSMINAAVASGADIDVVERMYALMERSQERAAKSAYLGALKRARAELPSIVKRGTISQNVKDERGNKTGEQKKMTTFAKWEDVVETILPVLNRNDLVLAFSTEQTALDRVSVTAILSHTDGHSEKSQMALGIDTSGAKNNAQGWGSAVSYGKRYTSFALLNLVGRDEDNDGAGLTPETISEAQFMELAKLIKDTGSDLQKFLDLGGVESLSDIPEKDFDKAKNLLLEKQRAKAKAKP